MNGKCPICTLDCQLDFEGLDADVTCGRCGKFMALTCARTDLRTRSFGSVPKFLVNKGADPRDTTKVGQLLAPYLSMYVREQIESGRRPPEIDIGTATRLEELAETYSNTPIALKPEKLLRFLERRTAYPGAPARFNAHLDYPAVHAVDAAEFAFYVKALDREGLIETAKLPLLGFEGDYSLDLEATIALSGWAKLGASGSASRNAFVAMSFHPSLNIAFSEGIEPAIRDAAYVPVRVNRVHHNEKICDRIVAEIRRSRFLIADVTMQRQGVYFEAGFAMALGLPVIWCCRKDDFENVHFDTRQYNHIVWEQPQDLQQQLRDRIQATIGTIH